MSQQLREDIDIKEQQVNKMSIETDQLAQAFIKKKDQMKKEKKEMKRQMGELVAQLQRQGSEVTAGVLREK